MYVYFFAQRYVDFLARNGSVYVRTCVPSCLQLVIDEYEKLSDTTARESRATIFQFARQSSTYCHRVIFRRCRIEKGKKKKKKKVTKKRLDATVLSAALGHHRMEGEERLKGRRRKKKKVQKETSRSFHAHIVHETIAFFPYLFLLPRLHRTRVKLTLMISSISGTSPLLVPFSWLSSAIL